MALWPFALTCMVWWALYKIRQLRRHQLRTSTTSIRSSRRSFSVEAFERIPVLLFAQLGIVPAEIYGFSPDPMPLYLIIACLFIGGVIYLLWPLLKESPSPAWAAGALFSVAPSHHHHCPPTATCCSSASAHPCCWECSFIPCSPILQTSRLHRGGTWILVVIHLILAPPLLMPVFSYSPQIWSQLMGCHWRIKSRSTIPMKAC